MKALLNNEPAEPAENVVSLPVIKPKRRTKDKSRFRLIEFQNKDSVSYRVAGWTRSGARIRENYSNKDEAETRRVELELEFMGSKPETLPRVTSLSSEELRFAEAVFPKLVKPADIVEAVAEFLAKASRATPKAEAPRLEKAFEDFKKWLELTKELRERSKGFLRTQVNIFVKSSPNLRVSDFTPEMISEFISRRDVTKQTKINSRLALNRFFNWCAEMPRKWIENNPCRTVKLKAEHNGQPPAILTVDECRNLMTQAEKFHRGKLVPYLAVCMFAGLRPAEAARLTLDKINLADREIRIEAQATKTKRPRVVKMDDTTHAWLLAYKKKPFHIPNHRRHLDTLKRKAGFAGRVDEANKALKAWPHDVLRHTSISHRFRKTGSYGLTAEWAGNSENVIKNHYQGRVTSDETAKFYAIKPTKKGTK